MKVQELFEGEGRIYDLDAELIKDKDISKIKKDLVAAGINVLKAQAHPYADRSVVFTVRTEKSNIKKAKDIIWKYNDGKYVGVTEGLITEGAFVIKSKDGVEKRFKDADSAEAKQWKETTAKKSKPKAVAYSDQYWADKKEVNPDRIVPTTPIGPDDSEGINRAVAEVFNTPKTDWTFSGKGGLQKRDIATCAVRTLRVMFEYGPEDDMGVDEPAQDVQYIVVGRNPQNPKQIDFMGYK